MSSYEKYIQRLCCSGKYTPEQARELAISRAVEEFYRRNGESDALIHYEFRCCCEA